MCRCLNMVDNKRVEYYTLLTEYVFQISEREIEVVRDDRIRFNPLSRVVYCFKFENAININFQKLSPICMEFV